jgi:hypothetical protein
MLGGGCMEAASAPATRQFRRAFLVPGLVRTGSFDFQSLIQPVTFQFLSKRLYAAVLSNMLKIPAW